MSNSKAWDDLGSHESPRKRQAPVVGYIGNDAINSIAQIVTGMLDTAMMQSDLSKKVGQYIFYSRIEGILRYIYGGEKIPEKAVLMGVVAKKYGVGARRLAVHQLWEKFISRHEQAPRLFNERLLELATYSENLSFEEKLRRLWDGHDKYRWKGAIHGFEEYKQLFYYFSIREYNLSLEALVGNIIKQKELGRKSLAK